MRTFANLVIKNAKTIIAIWAFLFVIMAIFAIQLPSKLEGDGFFVDDDHMRVTEELAETFGLPAKTIFILFDNKTDEQINSVLTDMAQVEQISEIVSPLDNDNFKKDSISYALLHFDNTVTDYPAIVDKIRDIYKGEQGISITGEPVISKDINLASQKDLIKAETIGVPIALIVLLLAFGTIVSALLPIIIGFVTVVVTFGVLSLLGDTVHLSIFVLNIVPMLGLALSIDFALLFINRYREERMQYSVEQSITTAIQTAGRSIIFSALCVMIGLGALIVIQVEIFQNIALGGAIIVAFAVLTGLTLLPASIIVLGDKLNKGRILRVKSNTTGWLRFASFIIQRPIIVIVVAVALLVVAMIPIKDIELTIPSTDSLPPSYEARATYDTLDKQFDLGKQAQLFLLAEGKVWTSEDGLQTIYDIQQTLLDKPLVKEVQSPFTVANIESPEMWGQAKQNPQVAAQLVAVEEAFIQDDKTYIVMTLDANGSSSEAQQFVRDLKDENLGIDFALSGRPKFNQEIFDEISNKIGLALAIILSTTFIILMIAFRSLLIPLKAILMNVIGLASTFGILVYIFQYGHFGLQEGTIALIIPVLVFCLVFGLSMDYEVFLISRIQEEYNNGASNTQATIDGLVSTSKIITSAALIMIVITGAFAFTDVMPVKQIGIGIAIAITIDATIIRLMLVPSLMKLLGEWNWWLPFVKRK